MDQIVKYFLTMVEPNKVTGPFYYITYHWTVSGYNTLQHTVTHYNTLQHTVELYTTLGESVDGSAWWGNFSKTFDYKSAGPFY